MPTLAVIIDASRAKEGAAEFKRAADDISKGASQADRQIADLNRQFAELNAGSVRLRASREQTSAGLRGESDALKAATRESTALGAAQKTLNSTLSIGGTVAKGFITSLGVGAVIGFTSAIASAAANMLDLGSNAEKAAKEAARVADQLERLSGIDLTRINLGGRDPDFLRNKQLGALEDARAKILAQAPNATTTAEEARALAFATGIDISKAKPTSTYPFGTSPDQQRFTPPKAPLNFSSINPFNLNDDTPLFQKSETTFANSDILQAIEARTKALKDDEEQQKSTAKAVEASNRTQESAAQRAAELLVSLQQEAEASRLAGDERKRYVAILELEDAAREAGLKDTQAFVNEGLKSVDVTLANERAENIRTQTLRDLEKAVKEYAEADEKAAKERARIRDQYNQFANKTDEDLSRETTAQNDRRRGVLDDLALRERSVGLTSTEIEKQRVLRDLDSNKGDFESRFGEGSFAEFRGATSNRLDQVGREEAVAAFNQDISSTLQGGITDALRSGDVRSAITDVFGGIVSQSISAGIAKPAGDAIAKALNLGVLFATGVAAANGAVFDRGPVKHFAAGDVFDSPTSFGFGQGGRSAGVLGEAGPEGILPLKRDAGGKLGVAVVGGNGGNAGTVVNQNLTFNVTVGSAADADTFRRSTRQVMEDARRHLAGGR